MSKREGALKSLFTAEMKRHLPHFYMLLHSTAGAPDRSITGAGRTTFWEFKHGTPDFLSPGDQELMCCRLDMVSHCRYVIWQEVKGVQRTLIVRPIDIHQRTSWTALPALTAWPGFNMKTLVRYVGAEHGLRKSCP